MAETAFQETTVDGPRTKLWKLNDQECPELSSHRIARLGWDDAGPRPKAFLAPIILSAHLFAMKNAGRRYRRG